MHDWVVLNKNIKVKIHGENPDYDEQQTGIFFLAVKG